MIGSLMILCDCAKGRGDLVGVLEHPIAWAELGLAYWVQSQFRGQVGRMRNYGAFLTADLVDRVRADPPKLRKLFRRSYDHLIGDAAADGNLLPHAHAFVHFCMHPKSGLRSSFESFIFEGLGEGKGGGTSVFRRHFPGTPDELETRLRAFLK